MLLLSIVWTERVNRRLTQQRLSVNQGKQILLIKSFNPFSAGIDFRHQKYYSQILMSKVNPCGERIKKLLMASLYNRASHHKITKQCLSNFLKMMS